MEHIRHDTHSDPWIVGHRLTGRLIILANLVGQSTLSILRKGNNCRLIVRQCNGPVLLVVPLTIGAVGAIGLWLFARLRWTFLLAIIGMFFRLQILVEPALYMTVTDD